MADPRLADVDALLAQLTDRLREPLFQDAVMIGIHTGGAWLAERLHAELGLPEPLGTLDIGLHRDDFARSGIQPRTGPSDLPVSPDDRHVILVDDVLYTGRTIRAAMNEIFDYGRPRRVTLAVLVQRDGRELPIQPDLVGINLSLQPDEQVKLSGPNPLVLSIKRKPD